MVSTHSSSPASALAFAPPPLDARPGAIIWITGLAATGKSRLAAALSRRLESTVPVEVLDGDDVRRHLSRNADGSCEGRAHALARVGFVARLLARHGVIAIASASRLDNETRAEVKRAAEADAVRFVDVFVEADLDALIEAGAPASDRARVGSRFVPDVTVRLEWQSLDESLDRIVTALERAGIVSPSIAGSGG